MPENHDCPGLQEWNDPSGVFGTGSDDETGGATGRAKGTLDRVTGTGGPLSYFRGNISYVFLAVMVVTFLLEWIVLLTVGQGAFLALFVLQADRLGYVWTWVTSVFSHSPSTFWHLAGNSIVLFFFGPLVERYVGSRKFAALFLVSGVLAGLAHVGVSLLMGGNAAVLGASGAIFAVLGVLTVLNPGLRIYLYFLIPVPLWLFTLAYAGISVLFFIEPSVAGAAGQGNVAHFAHLIGLVIGLAYGQHVKGRRSVPNQLQFGGGGAGGPGRGRF